MNKRNYQRELDTITAEIENKEKKPVLLLHVCCAPCSSYCLRYLTKYFKIVADFYNPNIAPKEEFEKRALEFKRFVKEYGFNDIQNIAGRNAVDISISEYDSKVFYDVVRGYEDAKEGHERCFICYRLRMEHAAKMAKEIDADYFTTTLSISPLKNAEKINEIGEELELIYGVKHLPSDFKKKDGYKQSVELSAQYNLYRQDYCGCVFSKRERELQSAVN